MKHILSFSGGKDSTFLLLELVRRKEPLDEVVFFDTGWEFPAMYKHIEKCKKMCTDSGVRFTTLRPKQPFDYLMFAKPVNSRKGGTHYGYSWCGGACRWGTTEKQKVLDRYAEQNKGSIVYIGIAADEATRLEKERAKYKRFPLGEWGVTEAECLKGCYEVGFDWERMYEHLDRLSCKFCTNKNLKELRNIRNFYPVVWEELKRYQLKTNRPYKGEGQSVFDLEKRFELEEKRLAKGMSITSRDFFEELRKENICDLEEQRL